MVTEMVSEKYFPFFQPSESCFVAADYPPPPRYVEKSRVIDIAQSKNYESRQGTRPGTTRHVDRLQNLAKRYCVALTMPKPRMLQTSFTPSCLTPGHQLKARELLAYRRTIDPEYKAPGSVSKVLKSKEAVEVFSLKEVNRALEFAVRQGDDPGVIEALIQMGADVNVSRRASRKLYKRLAKKDQDDIRSNVLICATTKGYLEIVQVLAPRADQVSLDRALANAINSRQISVIKCLLERGANPTAAESEIFQAIADNAEAVMEMVLLAPKRLSKSFCSTGLLQAVRSGSLRISILLLLNEANADYDDGRGLHQALAACRADLVLALVMAPEPPSESSLDEAVSSVYQNDGISTETKLELMEICLAGGAQGDRVSRTLALATHRGELPIIRLLLSYGASVDAYGGIAMQKSISDGRFDILDMLLKGQPHVSTLGTILKQAFALPDSQTREHVCSLLFRNGACDSPVASELLASAVEKCPDRDAEALVQLFLDEGKADVNYDGGKSVQVATRRGLHRILRMLLARKPLQETINGAVLDVFKSSPDIRLDLMHQLLQAGASGETVHEALITTVENSEPSQKSATMQLARLLLRNNASVDYDKGRSVSLAVAKSNLDLLKIMLTARPSAATIRSAMVTAQTHCHGGERYGMLETLLQHETPQKARDECLLFCVQEQEHPDLDLINLLLSFGASPLFSDAASILHATRRLDLQLVELLGTNISHKLVWSNALEALIEAARPGHQYFLPEYLPLIRFLLKKGARSDVASSILPELVEGVDRGEALMELLTTFLEYQVDVNEANGKALQVAAERGNMTVLAELLKFNATKETISAAFSAMLLASLDPNLISDMIDLFVTHGIDPALCSGDGGSSPIYLALQRYPDSAPLIRRLCSIGFKVDALVETRLDSHNSIKPTFEKANLLLWALSIPMEDGRELDTDAPKPISSEVIHVLIDAGANVNFVSSTTKMTPMIMAARAGRADVIFDLIQHDAKHSARDSFDRSPLFYASRNGNSLSMTHILRNNPGVNDGSLHEAARELHPEAVTLLIRNGHRPDFASTKHSGRTALAELCLLCDTSRDCGDIEATLEALIRGGLDPLRKCAGKTALFYALENVDPIIITQRLLDRCYWEYVDHPNNIYECNDHFYSPTMFIEKGFVPLEKERSTALKKILYNFDAKDRYYAKEGQDQPRDAVGLPPALEEYERKKRLREERKRQEDEDHLRAKARMLENAELDMRIRQGVHEQSLEHGDENLHQRHHGIEMTSYLETSLEQRQRGLRALDTQRDRKLELEYLEDKENQRLVTLALEKKLIQAHQYVTNQESLRHNTATHVSNLAFQKASSNVTLATQRAQNWIMAERETAQRNHQYQSNEIAHHANLQKATVQSHQNALAAEANRQRLLTQRAELTSQLQHYRAMNRENATHQGHMYNMERENHRVLGQQAQLAQQQETQAQEYRHRMRMLEMSQERENDVVKGKVKALGLLTQG